MKNLSTAIRAELFVVARNWKLWLLLASPAVAGLIRLLLIRVDATSANLQQQLSGRGAAPAMDYAYGYLVDAMSTGFIFIYLLFIAFAAFSFAIDRDHGVIRHLVIRQSSRRTVIAAKVIVLHVMALLACALVFVAALALSALLWDFGPVVEDGYELISVTEIHAEIQQGLLLALLPLPACLCLGLLLSIIANSALQAVSLGLGITLLLDIFKGALGNSAHYLYLSYQPSLLDNSYLQDVSRIARGFSDVLIDERVMQLNYWIPLPQALLFLIVALVLVRRKSL